MYRYDIRCSVCGRFCKPTDRSAPFASGGDLEEPDTEFYCRRCVRVEFEYHLKQGWIPNDWIKAKWHHALARKFDCVEVVDGINSWSYWQKRDVPLKPRQRIVWPRELVTPREVWDI